MLACTRWSLYVKVHLVFAMCRTEGHATSEWVGAAQSLDAGGSRDAERLAEVGTLHGLHVFN